MKLQIGNKRVDIKLIVNLYRRSICSIQLKIDDIQIPLTYVAYDILKHYISYKVYMIKRCRKKIEEKEYGGTISLHEILDILYSALIKSSHHQRRRWLLYNILRFKILCDLAEYETKIFSFIDSTKIKSIFSISKAVSDIAHRISYCYKYRKFKKSKIRKFVVVSDNVYIVQFFNYYVFSAGAYSSIIPLCSLNECDNILVTPFNINNIKEILLNVEEKDILNKELFNDFIKNTIPKLKVFSLLC